MTTYALAVMINNILLILQNNVLISKIIIVQVILVIALKMMKRNNVILLTAIGIITIMRTNIVQMMIKNVTLHALEFGSMINSTLIEGFADKKK